MSEVVQHTSAGSSSDFGGVDSAGEEYTSLAQLPWNKVPSNERIKKLLWWYGSSSAYWEKRDASLNDILGGLPQIHDADIACSEAFLNTIHEKYPSFGTKGGRVLDCGAGIGRVSRHLLVRYFDTLDLVEPAEKLLERAANDVSSARKEVTAPTSETKASHSDASADNTDPPCASPDTNASPASPVVGELGECFCESLQDFDPGEHSRATYRCIWVQWVLEHLIDEDFVLFFERCQKVLKPGGLLIVKENHARDGQGFFLDLDDCSMIRARPHLGKLFVDAGLRVVHMAEQAGFPRGMFPVKIWALTPIR